MAKNASDISPIDTDNARCWSCDYLLRGVQSPQCPECGRPFDLNVPESVNGGRPLGWLARSFLAPMGWKPVCLALFGAACAVGTARWPVLGWDPWPRDLPYYADLRAWAVRAPITSTDLAYTLGLAAATLGLGWALFRTIVRLIVVALFAVPRHHRIAVPRRWAALWLLTAVTAAGILAGWPYRLAQRWIAEFRVQSTKPGPQTIDPPGVIGFIKVVPMRSAIRQGWSLDDRMWAVKALSEMKHYPDLLVEAIQAERDPTVRLWEIRLAGLARHPSGGPLFLKLMEDPDPEIRAAAAEALGEINFPFGRTTPDAEVTASHPPVDHPRKPWSGYRDYPPPDGAREALAAQMSGGATPIEREAAARALLHWPPEPDPARAAPPYRFRLAEWGVIRVDANGAMRFLQAQLAQVPPFVHRIGDPAASLVGRLEPAWYMNGSGVGKPVLHLTTDVPLAVSIEIMMTRGRPLVAYPKPDDLLVSPRVTQLEYSEAVARGSMNPINTSAPPAPPTTSPYVPAPIRRSRDIASLDDLTMPPFDDPREGYPWMSPRHRKTFFHRLPPAGLSPPNTAAPTVNDLGGIGLLWQSLIVSPTKPPWAREAAVSPDARFAWWNRLREVDCSWVTSRGESERFLYYDGPSLAPPPFHARLENADTLLWTELPVPMTDAELRSGARRFHLARNNLYVECDNAGNAGMIALPPEQNSSVRHRTRLSQFPRRPATDADRQLDAMLRAHGLRPTEAAGLIDCWRDELFKTPGRRLLTVASGADYEAICPIVVHPPPTEMARVAIFWMELQ